MPDEERDESLGVEQLPQDELEATPNSGNVAFGNVARDNVSTPMNAEKPSANPIAAEETPAIDVEESRASKQPKMGESNYSEGEPTSHRRIATD